MADSPRFTARLQAPARVPLLQVVKVAIATVLAWFVAQLLLPTTLPVFAAIAALLVVQPSVNQSVGRAIERSVGVIAGVVIAYSVGVGVGLVFGQASWIVLLGIVVSIFIGWLLRLTPGSANQIPISAMLVLTIGAATPSYAFERIIETLLGAGIGLIINISIVPPVLLAPAHDAVKALAVELAATLDRLSEALSAPKTSEELEEMLVTARLLRPMQEKAQDALTAAEDSLAFNPRQQRHRVRLAADQDLFARLGPLVTRTLGMTRAIHDHYDVSLHEEPTVRAIVDELDRASHDLRLIVRSPEDPTTAPEPSTATQGLPLLTAPLRIPTPHPEHWVLIGSLMEDLRRVHEEIVGTE